MWLINCMSLPVVLARSIRTSPKRICKLEGSIFYLVLLVFSLFIYLSQTILGRWEVMWKFGFQMIEDELLSWFAVLSPMALKDIQTGFCFFFLSVSRRCRSKTSLKAVPSTVLRLALVWPCLHQEKLVLNWSWRAIRRGWDRFCSMSEGLGLSGCMWWWWHLTSFMFFELVKLVYP